MWVIQQVAGLVTKGPTTDLARANGFMLTRCSAFYDGRVMTDLRRSTETALGISPNRPFHRNCQITMTSCKSKMRLFGEMTFSTQLSSTCLWHRLTMFLSAQKTRTPKLVPRDSTHVLVHRILEKWKIAPKSKSKPFTVFASNGSVIKSAGVILHQQIREREG